MKKSLLFAAAGAGAFLAAHSAQAGYLYPSFLEPSFYGQANTEYSAWDVFYTPYGNPNYPDFAAPYGTWQSASSAGVTPPSNSNPSNPSAFWDPRNPTITQNGTSTAFIISPNTDGNIYSFAAPTSFTLQDTTPYTLGTVLFQFQTEGTLVDFSSIKLVYTDGTGSHELDPEEMLKEYSTSASSFGGDSNRTAVQWDLSGLDITSYQIVWSAQESSMSFQAATLDTSATFTSVIPASRTWNSGNGNWSDAGAWSGQTYTSANSNGNVNFVNTSAATINLDANQVVGELTFNTAANTRISSTGGFTLTSNTGITTTSAATGLYTIDANFQLGAFDMFEINSGTVQMNGVVSGTYGMLKTGNGTLILANNNTFTGGLGVQGGTLRVEGNNSYTGDTGVLWGSLVVAADAGNTGALGNSSNFITVGADSSLYTAVQAGDAALQIDGDHTISRGIALANGTFQKTLGAFNTVNGATFSGTVNLGTSDNVRFATSAASDKVAFSGAIIGGDASMNVTIAGSGTVVYSGAAKTYSSKTTVSAGTLVIAAGSSFTGSGTMTVANGAKLQVDGTLGGSAGLALNGTLTGVGSVNRAVTTGGVFSTISAGTGPGTLTVASLNAASGVSFVFDLGTASDRINVSGLLTGSTTAGNLQFQFLAGDGAQAGVAYTLIGFGGVSGLDASDLAMLNSGGFVLDSTFHNGGWFIDTATNTLQVQFSAVPEPSTWALLGVAVIGLGAHLVRRRAARQTA